MVDITTIPTSELLADLADSEADIKTCQLALVHQINEWSGGSVQERLDKNRYFVKVITAELARRERKDYDMDEQYNHNWLEYMTPKTLALTAVNVFRGEFGDDLVRKADAMQTLFDELCERVGRYEAEDMIFHAPGMDQDLVDEFMELVE